MEKNDYITMFVGIAIFIGGIITYIIITKYLGMPVQAVSSSSPQISTKKFALKPILSEIKQEIEQEKPMGEAFNMPINVSDQLIELYEQKDGFPWSKVIIENQGPNPVYFAVNYWRGDPIASLQVGQSTTIDFKQRASIKKVFLKCDTGQNTGVVLYVVV